jgi:hypothetical protein
MNFFQFMSDSPILTFFLALIIAEVLMVLFKALGCKYSKNNKTIKQENEID